MSNEDDNLTEVGMGSSLNEESDQLEEFFDIGVYLIKF